MHNLITMLWCDGETQLGAKAVEFYVLARVNFEFSTFQSLSCINCNDAAFLQQEWKLLSKFAIETYLWSFKKRCHLDSREFAFGIYCDEIDNDENLWLKKGLTSDGWAIFLIYMNVRQEKKRTVFAKGFQDDDLRWLIRFRKLWKLIDHKMCL